MSEVERNFIGSLEWQHWGEECDFARVLEAQRSLRQKILSHSIENRTQLYALTCTHRPIITFGYRSEPERELKISLSELSARGVAWMKCERGGRATFHGPGSLMLYPVLHLPNWRLGARQYVQLLEDSSISFLQELGIQDSQKRRGEPGVWVGQRKIASIGIHLRGGVAIQGICLNINGDLTPYGWIDPCGQQGLKMTTLTLESHGQRDFSQLARTFVRHFWEKLQAAGY